MTQTQEPVDIGMIMRQLEGLGDAQVRRVSVGTIRALCNAVTAAEELEKDTARDALEECRDRQSKISALETKLAAAEAKAESGFLDGIKAAANNMCLGCINNWPLNEMQLKLGNRVHGVKGGSDWPCTATRIWNAAKFAPASPSTTGQTEHLSFSYRNWRGETAERCVQPLRLWYGSTKWHTEPQWFLRAIDAVKNEERDFALRDIQFVTGQTERELALIEFAKPRVGDDLMSMTAQECLAAFNRSREVRS